MSVNSLAQLCSLWQLPEESLYFASSSFWGCRRSLACSHITPVFNASVFTSLSVPSSHGPFLHVPNVPLPPSCEATCDDIWGSPR